MANLLKGLIALSFAFGVSLLCCAPPEESPEPTRPGQTYTSRPTATARPSPTPRCRPEIQFFDFPRDLLETAEKVIGHQACISYFNQYQPGPRYVIDLGLLVDQETTKDRLFDLAHKLNKELFSSADVGCVMIMMFTPYSDVAFLNQGLGHGLATQYDDQWQAMSASEWWSWLEEHESTEETISEDCERNNWATWNDQAAYGIVPTSTPVPIAITATGEYTALAAIGSEVILRFDVSNLGPGDIEDLDVWIQKSYTDAMFIQGCRPECRRGDKGIFHHFLFGPLAAGQSRSVEIGFVAISAGRHQFWAHFSDGPDYPWLGGTDFGLEGETTVY